MRQTHSSDRRRPELFAARQVYVRSGSVCQYVTVSRRLQIAVAAGVAVIALWLGLASYIALARHSETVDQERDLARLESISKPLPASFDGLRKSFDKPQEDDRADGGIEAGADPVTEVAELKASRERAVVLANAATSEADALRREVALAYERIRELEARLNEAAPAAPAGANGVRVTGDLLDRIACPSAPGTACR
jgi:hypothetical protein